MADGAEFDHLIADPQANMVPVGDGGPKSRRMQRIALVVLASVCIGLACFAGQTGLTMSKSTISLWFTWDSAARMEDDHLVDILAAASNGAYTVVDHGYTYKPDWFKLEDHQDLEMGKRNLGWSLFTVRKGDYKNKTILAFRGTNVTSAQQLMQDISAVYNGPSITYAGRSAVKAIRRLKPDYITGHSLGGLLAEIGCSYTGTPGASFAAPGPIGATMNLADGMEYKGVDWRVVLNVKDAIARTIGGIQGSSRSHIAHSSDITWLRFSSRVRLVSAHSIVGYINALLPGGLP